MIFEFFGMFFECIWYMSSTTGRYDEDEDFDLFIEI